MNVIEAVVCECHMTAIVVTVAPPCAKVFLHSPLGLVARLLAQGGSDTWPCQGSRCPRSIRPNHLATF